MPSDWDLPTEGMLYHRDLYAKSALTRFYFHYKEDLVVRFLPSEGTIVDMCCGEGLLLGRLVQRYPGARVLGIDLSDENVRICRGLGLPAVRASIYRTPLATGSVDACLLIEALEHLDEPAEAANEIRRVLRPGGVLLALFPNDLVFKVARLVTLKWREANYAYGHVHQWTPGEVDRLLSASGFKVERHQSIPGPWFFSSLAHLVVGRRIDD